MDELTKKCIEKRIDIILKEFDFEKRRKEYPEECPCNGIGPCHNIEDLNCFFCYCPAYDLSKPEGGCKIGNPQGKGKWFERLGHEVSDRIWDCGECTYPHQKKIIRKYLWRLFTGQFEDKI